MLIQIKLVLFFTFYAILLNKDMLQRVNVIKVGEMIRTKRLGAKRTGREKTEM